MEKQSMYEQDYSSLPPELGGPWFSNHSDNTSNTHINPTQLEEIESWEIESFFKQLRENSSIHNSCLNNTSTNNTNKADTNKSSTINSCIKKESSPSKETSQQRHNTGCITTSSTISSISTTNCDSSTTNSFCRPVSKLSEKVNKNGLLYILLKHRAQQQRAQDLLCKDFGHFL